MKPINEIFFESKKQTKNLFLKYYPTDVERREIIAKLGDPAFMLYEYYLRMASFKDKIEPTDDHAAEYFSWDLQKVRRNRRRLTKEGWIRFKRMTDSDGNKALVIYLGKEKVEESLGKARPGA